MKTFKANSLMWYCRYAAPIQVKVLRNVTVKNGDNVQIECEVSHDVVQVTAMPLSRRLADIEEREGISGNEMAKIIGVTSSDYHGSLKQDKNPPNTAWRIALYFIDRYRVNDLFK